MDSQPTDDKPPSTAAARRKRRLIIVVLRTLVLAYVAICAFMYFYQYRLIYLPDKEYRRTPDRFGVDYTDALLTTADGLRLAAWYLEPKEPRGALILCHGNAGNMADRLDIAGVFCQSGLAVLLFDYRGYGQSEGSPDEAGTYADAEAAWGFLTGEKSWPADRIVLYGESIGGAVAIELASRHRPAALITESTFTTLYDVAKTVYPYLPVRLLARVRYESIHKIAGLDCPILLIHSPDDELVPYSHGQALFDAARPPKQFLSTRGGHNDGGFLADSEYVSAVRRLLDEVLEPVPTAAPSP